MTELQRRELEQGLWRDLEQFVRDEAELAAPARPAPLRGLLRLRALGAGAPARSRPRRRAHALREDRPDRRRPVQRARDRPGLQVRADGPLGGADRVGAAAPDPALHARAARPRRDRAARRRLPALAGERRARGLLRAEARTTPARVREERLPRRGRVLGAGRRAPVTARAASRSGSAPATCGTTRRGGRLPGLVRPLADVPGAARMSATRPERAAGAAIEASGHVFVSAGAGTGKTSVLVERFARRSASAGSTSTRCS